MLLKLAPLLIGLAAAYLWRARIIHAHLTAKRPLRALWAWLKGAVITVPLAAVAIISLFLLNEILPFN